MPTSIDKPRDAGGWYRLGNNCGQSGDHERAAFCFAKALELRPGTPEIVRNLGATLHILGRIDEAIDCYRRFLEKAPGTAEIYFNLGNALSDAGLHAAAVESYRNALSIKPRWGDAQIALGHALDAAGDPDGAAAQYQSVVTADPASGLALRCLAGALADQGRAEEALARYAQLPAEGASQLHAAMLLPAIPASVDEIQHWRQRFAAGVARLAERPPALENPLAEGAGTAFYLSYHGLPNRDLHRDVAALYERACPSLLWQAAQGSGAERIRVGFISRYLSDHSIGKTTRGLIAGLSRDRFETVALFVPPVPDDETSRFIRARSDRFVVLPADLAAARRAIAALRLDVLFYQDIGMEPFTYFLAFSRLAPVQCVSFGHPDTTGISAIDYFVSNDLFEVDGAQAHYSERLFLLRDLGTLAYYYRPSQPARKGRQAFGLPEGGLYFCAQSLFKIHPSLDPMLGEILRGDPSARLLLIEGRSRHWGRLLRERFARAFPDVVERVVFLPPQSGADFTSLIAACDVVLDTPHFNGMNTSLEAFAAGTPVVTMPTELQRGRHTAGMYRKMGFTDCVARTSDDYVRIALRLGRDEAFRRHAARQIAQRSEVLFEDRRAVSEFERFFSEVVG